MLTLASSRRQSLGLCAASWNQLSAQKLSGRVLWPQQREPVTIHTLQAIHQANQPQAPFKSELQITSDLIG